MSTPADLEQSIEAYEAMRETLEKHHLHKFVVFHDAAFVDSFDSFHNAASEAVHRFALGPYLIRQVGAPRRMVMRNLEEYDDGHRLRSSTPFTGLIMEEERFETIVRHPPPRTPSNRVTPTPPNGLARVPSEKPLREDSRPASFQRTLPGPARSACRIAAPIHRGTIRANAESSPRDTTSDFSCDGTPCNT